SPRIRRGHRRRNLGAPAAVPAGRRLARPRGPDDPARRGRILARRARHRRIGHDDRAPRVAPPARSLRRGRHGEWRPRRGAGRGGGGDEGYEGTARGGGGNGGVGATARITFVAVRGAARRLVTGLLAMNDPVCVQRVFPAYTR